MRVSHPVCTAARQLCGSSKPSLGTGLPCACMCLCLCIFYRVLWQPLLCMSSQLSWCVKLQERRKEKEEAEARVRVEELARCARPVWAACPANDTSAVVLPGSAHALLL